MEVLKYVLIGLEVVTSIVLIITVLLQSGKEAGLGALAGNNGTYMGNGKGNRLDKVLASATKWIALVWLLLTLSLHFV